jgi:hypothetical protein
MTVFFARRIRELRAVIWRKRSVRDLRMLDVVITTQWTRDSVPPT